MMKRYLLSLIALACAVTGAWAEASSIGSTSSTYEKSTQGGKTVLTINIAAVGDLTAAGWLSGTAFGDQAPDDVKTAVDCIVIKGPLGTDDAQGIQAFQYTLLNLYGATLASGVSGSNVYVRNTTPGIIVPKGMTAADWLKGNSSPYQYKALFSIDETSSTVTADIRESDGNFAAIMQADRDAYHFFGNNNESDNTGCSTLTINAIAKEYVNNSETGNYIESGVNLTSDIINGINNANHDFTTINVEGASASNLSMIINNTHVTTLNLANLTLDGDVTLDIGGDIGSSMRLQTVNLQNLEVKTVDATDVKTLTNVNLAGASITSVDFTRTDGDYSNLSVTVDDPDKVSFTPTAATMWGEDEAENHVMKPAVVYTETDMHLHDGHAGVADDKSNLRNYVYWYQGDTDATGIATINARGSIAATLESEAYQADKTFVKVKVAGWMGKADLADLSKVKTQILDLSELDLTHSGACTIADLSTQFCTKEWDLDPAVKFVVLPEGATRDAILSADKVSSLKNVYSLVSFTHDDDGKFDFTAYNRQRGTLAAALVAGDKKTENGSMQYGTHNSYTPEMTKNNKKKAVISGQINAYDLVSSPSVSSQNSCLDENGHLTFNKTYADETLLTDDRVNVGKCQVYGGFSGSTPGPETLDLKYAEIEGPQYINDIKISTLIANYGPIKYLTIPETASVTETPSYFITHNEVKEICIPSNIQTVRTHFAPSVDHIWTTGYQVGTAGGDAAEMTYDNGCYASLADETNPAVKPSTGYTNFTFGDNLYPYGTYTFSSNLKLIETGAFANTQPHVKDVYVLAKKAPECHVDAFNTKMYVGNNGFKPNIVGGVITRDSYSNGDSWITMLHYPRECETPDVQRYTDPTRQYNVASNEVDGRGGVIYYPMQGEFITAYAQGTTGYLWNAWERLYQWGMMTEQVDLGTDGWKLDHQRQANAAFLNNPDLAKYPGNTKYTCTSFYDVTADGQLQQPAGLVPYYDVRWDEKNLSDKGAGAQLYPEKEVAGTDEFRYTVATADDFNNNINVYTINGSGEYVLYSGAYSEQTTYYKRLQLQKTDESGHPVFKVCASGTYVQDTRYVEAEDGGYVLNRTVSSYESTDKPVDGVEQYYSAQEASAIVTPKVGSGLYYQDGMKNEYVAVNKSSDAIGAKDEYYKKEGDSYVKLDALPFVDTKQFVYKTGTAEVPVYEKISGWQLLNTVLEKASEFYVRENGTYVSYLPKFNTSIGTIYYKKSETEYEETNAMVAGVTKYYTKSTDYEGNDTYTEANLQLDGTEIYYATGRTEKQNTYSERQLYYSPGKEWFTYDINSEAYSARTLSWWEDFQNIDYYYPTTSVPNIVTAQNTDYNPATTYYTDAAGTTEATEVKFNGTYYYPVYNDQYVAYNAETDADKQRYTTETYYRQAVEADGASVLRYCPEMEDVTFHPVTKQYDYRGWHQFVLTAYSKGTDIPMQPSRSYQTDDDWWTICLPYDLTYNEVMLFYGDVNETGQPDASKVPVVCLLSNVVREPAKDHIRLNFSSNLMEHKAQRTDGEWVVTDEAPNHLKAATTTTDEETGETTVTAQPDIIIHRGVPYAIKPKFKPNAGRQFDVYGRSSVNEAISQGRITATSDDYPGLYEKLKAAESIAGADFRAMQEDNLYTVPCLIPVDQAKDDDVVDKNVISYDGVDYYRSKSLDYTFVGSLQRNIIPPFGYFLGYKNKSLFVYADYDTKLFDEKKTDATPDYRNTFKWTNNACVICPNLLSNECKDSQKGSNNKYNLQIGKHKGLVTEASKESPARWVIYNEKVSAIGGMSILTDDRFPDEAAPSRGIFDLGDEIHYGYDMISPTTDGIETVGGEEPSVAVGRASRRVYSVNGQYMGDSLQGLKRGLYIVGGKKYVVK